MTLLIYKMRRLVCLGVTSNCRSARPTGLFSERNQMAGRDSEFVFNSPRRFGACFMFILMEGTYKCRTCGCIARFCVPVENQLRNHDEV